MKPVITDTQIDFINYELVSGGLSSEELRESILEHMLTAIEVKMGEGVDFFSAYESVRLEVWQGDLKELQQEADNFDVELEAYQSKWKVFQNLLGLVSFGFVGFFILGYNTALPAIKSILLIGIIIFLLGFIPLVFFEFFLMVSQALENRFFKLKLVISGFFIVELMSLGAFLTFKASPIAVYVLLAGFSAFIGAFLPALFGMRIEMRKRLNILHR